MTVSLNFFYGNRTFHLTEISPSRWMIRPHIASRDGGIAIVEFLFVGGTVLLLIYRDIGIDNNENIVDTRHI